MKTTKKNIKGILYTLFLPFLIIINPFSIKEITKMKNFFLSFMYSVFLTRTWSKIQCKSLIDFKCVKHFRIKGFINIGKKSVIEWWDSYRKEKFNPIMCIGNGVIIGDSSHIGCINMMEIRNNTLIVRNVFITDHSHGECNDTLPPIERKLVFKGPVIIGNNCWIVENVSILPDVSIGNNVTIGANSVVTKSFRDNLVIAGNPAKIIKSKDV